MPSFTPGEVAVDSALFALRFVTGLFFVLYRFRWVYDPTSPEPIFCPQRHEKLRLRVVSCGYWPWLAAPVALVEIFAGFGLMAGLFTHASALGLIVIMIFGQLCLMPEELPKMNPVDGLDWVRCFLMWPEPLYTVMCGVILVCGPGRLSFDYLLWTVV